MTRYKTRESLVWTVESFALHHAVRMYKTYSSALYAYCYISLHIIILSIHNTLF